MMKRPPRLFFAAAAASAVLLTAACGSDAEENPTDNNTSVQPVTPGDTTQTPQDAPSQGSSGMTDGAFTAGEYEAIGSYQTPGGVQGVEVEVELAADGTITDIDVDGQAESGDSVQFQGFFEKGIEAEVVGKKITELNVSKVSGSSLTSGGFNSAIEQIIDQARG